MAAWRETDGVEGTRLAVLAAGQCAEHRDRRRAGPRGPEGGDHAGRRLVFTDDGFYDNLDPETVWKRYQVVLVSDAEVPFALQHEPGIAWQARALRAMDVGINQARALCKRALIDDFIRKTRTGAHWGIPIEMSAWGEWGVSDARRLG